jgi:sialic acid synthase SpsE
MSKTFVIAEAGSTWYPHEERMQELIYIASDAGADAVKFQWCSNGVALAMQRGLDVATGQQYATYLCWSSHWMGRLAEIAKLWHLDFMCTSFLPQDVLVIAPYISRFKIASLEARNWPFVAAHAYLGKEVIVSTGGMEYLEVHDVWSKWQQMPLPTSTLRCLHCVASYPAPIDEVNLSVLTSKWLPRTGTVLGTYDGFSDHTSNVLTGALAVMVGAKIIEVHMRHPLTPPDNPDYPHSHDPDSLKQYIQNIRIAEQTLGDGNKRVMPSEQWVKELKYA